MADARPEIARIDALSAAAKTSWFALLGYLAFAGVTLLGVEDADFFLDSRRTDLPLVGVAIPTREFFVFGPILATALFVYLHLYLLKLWEAIAEATPCSGGTPLTDRVAPWLVADLGLALKGGGAARGRPMDWFSHLVTFLLVFAVGPLTVGYFWVRYWPAHEPGATLLAGALTVLTVMTMASSLWVAVTRLRFDQRYRGGWWHLLALVPTLVLLEAVAEVSVARTGRPDWLPGWVASPAGDATNAPAVADLREVTFTPLPADWLPYETHKRRFRVDWCAREGLDAETCGPPPYSGTLPAPHLGRVRAAWCAGLLASADQVVPRYSGEDPCTAYFAALDARFLIDWRSERETRGQALAAPNLQGSDLRRADLTSAGMTFVDLRRAAFAGADMVGVDLEGANLFRADLSGANLWGARAQGGIFIAANLANATLGHAQLDAIDLESAWVGGVDAGHAKMVGADLRDARGPDADFFRTDLRDADLSGAELPEAFLREADLRGAEAVGLDLPGASLWQADLGGASFAEADMNGADLRLARMQGTVLRRADLRNARLDLSLLTGTPGTESTLRGLMLAGSANAGGALRHLDLGDVEIGPGTDWRNAFYAPSVTVPETFRAAMGGLCQQPPGRPLRDREFYGRWRGWLDVAPPDTFAGQIMAGSGWRYVAPEDWHDVEPIPPPAGCVWKTGAIHEAGTPAPRQVTIETPQEENAP